MNKDCYVDIDYSKAYLLARFNYEARKVLGDNWLSDDRRNTAGTMYTEVGKDFNQFFFGLTETKDPNTLYMASLSALTVFRDNIDVIWMYAYSGIEREIIWLTK